MLREYNLSQKQNEYILNAHARWNLKVGAVRSGKSFVDVVHVIPAGLIERANEPGLNVILGVTRETIERNVLQPMREMYTSAIVGDINNRNIVMICGVPVYCLGAEKVTQVSKIQGASIKYCYGDEIAKWHRDVFALLQSRLDKPYSRFDGSCNPETPGHWLKQFIDREDIDSYIQKYTIFDNPFLPQKFVQDLCTEYSGTVYYKRYIEGEWSLAEGLIYPMYAEAVEAPPNGFAQKYVLSLDYGIQNAFAGLLWAQYGDVWYAVSEYYYSGRDTGSQKTDEEYAEDLDKWLDSYFEQLCKEAGYSEQETRVRMEALRPLRTIIDPSASSFIALLRKHERRYKAIKADNDVLDGIRETATVMKRGTIKISPQCKNWLKEVQGYVWEDNEYEDRPVKVGDHLMDAMRYHVKTMRLVKPKTQYISVM